MLLNANYNSYIIKYCQYFILLTLKKTFQDYYQVENACACLFYFRKNNLCYFLTYLCYCVALNLLHACIFQIRCEQPIFRTFYFLFLRVVSILTYAHGENGEILIVVHVYPKGLNSQIPIFRTQYTSLFNFIFKFVRF